MAQEPKTKPKTTHQALVMLVQHEDGTLSIIDGTKRVHEVRDAVHLMETAKGILGSKEMPALESAPSSGPSVKEKREEQELEEAFGTLGNRLRDVAEAEFGAPLVDAASTVVGHAGKKASGFFRKLSRPSGSRRRIRRRRSA